MVRCSRVTRFSISRKHYSTRQSMRRSKMIVKIPRANTMIYPISIPLHLVKLSPNYRASSLKQLGNMLSCHVPPNWSCKTTDNVNDLVLISFNVAADSPSPSISFVITIHQDFTWDLCYRNIIVPPQSIPKYTNELRSVSGVLNILDFLDKKAPSLICCGNNDERFRSLPRHSAVISGKNVAKDDTSTIRHVKCEIFTSKGQRCKACEKYRCTLRAMLSKQRRKAESDKQLEVRVSQHSKMNDRYRTPSELIKKMSNVKSDLKAAQAKITKLSKALESAVARDGVAVDETTHDDLQTIMTENSDKVMSQYPENSFPRLFWNQQILAASQKKASSMRWHPVMIRWCLYLRHISGKGYEGLRESGCLHLPSPRTLRDYTHYNKTAIGFSQETDKQLLHTLTEQSLLQEWQKLVILLLDEVYVKEEVVYNKFSGKILGLIDIGDINNHLNRLEKSVTDSELKLLPAKTMLVIMVRGLCSQLHFPYAQFACGALTGEQMYTPVTEAIYRLERLGLKVLGITADGARANRFLGGLLNPSLKQPSDITYKVPNPYCDEERDIFIFSDPPHLIKTIRNCVSNKRRQLSCKGRSIKWEHIERLYQKLCQSDSSTPGLSLIPKLKYEHIHLNSFSKMRVDLAAQALSESVAKALQLEIGAEAEGTAEMIMIVDKMFDCLNVRSCSEGRRKRKPARDPYTHADDWRLQWLEGDCLNYFKQWKESCHEDKMMLSKQTRVGIEMTVRAFVGLVKYLFTHYKDIKYFLSEKISQDPLERFFGCQRQRGRSNENPNVADFVKNTQALRVCNSEAIKPKAARCLTFDKENTQPLPKRKRKH